MSKYKKAIAGFVGFATAVTMSFGTASAATNEELQAQITALLAQITALQTQLGTAQTPVVVTGSFTKDLMVGSKGADVTALQTALGITPTTGYFGVKTKAALIKYQISKAITPAAGYFGPKTRATFGGTTTTTPVVVGTTLSAALSFDNPAAGTLIAGQAIGDLAHFTFSNSTGVEQKVTKLVFTRTGISNDATLVNVYLFEGAKRITDAASVSSTKITFNDASGVIVIPAGGMKTIALKADILSGSAGQVIGVSLGEVVGSVVVSGAFPILGNNHSIATATMAAVNFGATTPTRATTVVNTDIDPQTDYTLWSNTVSFTTRSANMTTMTFRQIGSALVDDVGNYKLFIDGVQVGTAVAKTDVNGYFTFDLTATPKMLTTGSHTFKVMGDIVGGSTKSFYISLQQAGDAVFMDSQLNQPILATRLATTFSSCDANTLAVNQGTLTITKKTDSPSGNITLGGTNALLAKYELKAAGEPIKVESLRINNLATSSAVYSLRNGALFADGVQVGNTLSILGVSTGATYTQFNLGSSLFVTPGKPVLLEIRADVYNDYTGGGAIGTASDTITMNIVAGSSNWKRTKSLTYDSNVATPANALTVASGALSGSSNAAYANQSVVKPQTNFKLASFNFVSTDVEPVNLNTIELTFTGSSVGVATGLTDVYVKYGTKTTSVKATVSTTTAAGLSGSYSINEVFVPNSTMPVEVWANLTTSLVANNTIITGVNLKGTTANSATAVETGIKTGQTITIKNGTIAGTVVTDASLATKLLVGNTQPKLASFRITATNDTYKISDVAISVASAVPFNYLVLKSAGMADKTIVLNGTIGTSTMAVGTEWPVAANSSTGTVIDVYGNLAMVGEGYATSTDMKVTLNAVKVMNSAGTASYATLTSAAGNSMYAFKSLPTIARLALPETTLKPAGTKVISRFSITPDSSASIGWRKIGWTMSKSAGVILGATSTDMSLYNETSGTTVAGYFATTTGSTATWPTTAYVVNGTSGTLTFVADAEEELSSTVVYSLKVAISGTSASADYLTMTIPNAGTYAVPNTWNVVSSETTSGTQTPTFVWTDRSMTGHSASTADWNNDYKVKTLPTDTWSLAGAT